LRGKVRIGYTPDGKPIDKNVSGKTKLELEIAKKACREHFVLGRQIPRDLAFYEYAEEWYRLKKEPFVSQASRASYKSLFIRHLLPAFGLQHMTAINAAQLQEFLNGFAGASRSQITLVVSTLKSIFASAYAEGIVERDPTGGIIRPKGNRKEERRALTREETKNVLRVAHSHPEGLILAVLYYLGLRRGEALGLKWGDFDFDENQVHIQRDIDFTGSTAQEGALKTRAADRYVPVPPELREMLLSRIGQPWEYVFQTSKGKPISQATFKRMWCRLMYDANCIEWRKHKSGTDREYDILKCVKPILTPHYFRHNFATLLYEAGVDPLIAMKIIGHSDYQTTANIYTHIRDDLLKKSTINMSEVFQKRE
jgi:integrase